MKDGPGVDLAGVGVAKTPPPTPSALTAGYGRPGLAAKDNNYWDLKDAA